MNHKRSENKVDRAITEKYEIRYDKMYFRGEKEPVLKRTKAMDSFAMIIFIFAIVQLSIVPFLGEVMLIVGEILWCACIISALVIAIWSEKIKKRDLELDFKYVVGLILRDKKTNEEHPGYMLADGGIYGCYGVNETIAANTTDGLNIPYASKIVKKRINTQVKFKRHENAKEFRRMVEDEDFQDEMVKAILSNENVYKEIRLSFFDTFSRGKKLYPGRLYTVSDSYGSERTVLIPSDCGFDPLDN